MTERLKLSQIVVEQERVVYQPSQRPGELPEKVIETIYVPIRISPSRTTRFVNWFIDSFIMGVVLLVSVPVLLSTYSLSVFTTEAYNVFSFLLFLGYYWGFEYFLQATPGKMANDCIVINEYGERPSPGQILGRTMIRLVPFDGLSFLGKTKRGWHDDWPDTYVVLKKDLPAIMEAKRKQEERYLDKQG